MKIKFIKIFSISFFSLFLGIISLNYLIDPLQYIRKAIYKPIYMNEARYQVAALARTSGCDSIILGTSHTLNFKPSTIKDILGFNSVKLSLSGGSIFEQVIVADFAFNQAPIKNVIWGLDTAYLPAEEAEVKNAVFPYHLYKSLIHALPKYLINIGVVRMSLEILLREFFGFKKLAYSSYQEDLDSYGMFLNDPSKSQVLMEEDKSYYSETRAHFDENSINSYIEPQDLYLLKENLKKVTEVIRSYPETQFYIFCPPYSITLFRKCHQKGLLNNFLAKHLIIMEELLKFKNVSLFNFLNKEAIIMNLNNYRDKTHYWKEINEKMIYSFKNNESRISNKEEALKSIHDLCNMVNKSNAFRQSQKENQPKISSG